MCCNSSEIACRALLGVFLLDILMSGLVLFCIATVISFIAIGWGTWGKNRSHNNALQFPTRLSSLSLNLTWKKIGQSYIFEVGFSSNHLSLLTLWRRFYAWKESAAKKSKKKKIKPLLFTSCKWSSYLVLSSTYLESEIAQLFYFTGSFWVLSSFIK